MPIGAQILTIAKQNNDVCLWALVDPTAPTHRRNFVMYGTGHDISGKENRHDYLGSVQLLDGSLVLHVFEKICHRS